MAAFLAAVTGRRLLPCPPSDPHACALYFYTEPGDHIGFHYDTSYYRGERFTVLVGLIERSSSRLVCQLYRDVSGRTPVDLDLKTDPGTVVLFNGDKLWHAIQFHTVGEATREVLAAAGVDYQSYAERAGLFERAPGWSVYVPLLSEHWQAWIDGRIA